MDGMALFQHSSLVDEDSFFFHDHKKDNAFTQINLVSDLPGVAAHTDANLVNPWGVSFSSTGPFWVSDNGTGVTTLYDGSGNPQTAPGGHTAITIAAPRGQSDPASPTGQVFNDARTGFRINDNGHKGPSFFLFATEDGTISGWNPGVNADRSIIAIDHSAEGDVFKGLALGHHVHRARASAGDFDDGKADFARSHPTHDARLFAADFAHGRIEVFNDKFHEIKSFTDPFVPTGFAPFNVQVLHGKLFVTFAKQDADKEDDVAGAGNGFVDEFDFNGHLLHRVASHSPLNSPWGMAIAPAGFGEFANDLLVGNFGDGRINAFDFKTGKFEGQLHDGKGHPIVIPGLWALEPGNAGANTDPNKIYFTAGPDEEQHGIFGSLGAAHNQPHQHFGDFSLMI